MTQKDSRKAYVRFGRYRIPVHGTRLQRTVMGIALCVGGALGFLPILGVWMLPLGILVLSVEYHPVRRFRRRIEVRYGRYRRSRAKRKGGPSG